MASNIDKIECTLLEFPRPKLLVFDLDYTIWPFWCDTHVTPPFRADKSNRILDKHKNKVKLYPESKKLLQLLKEKDFLIAAASRTETPDVAEKLLNLFEINQYFDFKQVYPGCKIKHFQNIQKDSGVEFEDMVFFDDEHRNIEDITSLGVTCQYVENGVSFDEVDKCFKLFREKRII